jgi:transposase-like protein
MPKSPPLPLLDINRQPLLDLERLVELLGERSVLRALDVHEKTLYKWRTQRIKIPGRQRIAIRMLLGDLPGTDNQWTGWMFRGGKLWSPENVPFTQGDLRASLYDKARISALTREVEKLRLRLAIAEGALEEMAPAANDARRA